MKRSSAIVALLLALSLAGLASAAETSVEDFIPAGSILSLCYYGDNTDLAKTALHQLVQEPEVQEWLGRVGEAMAGGNELARTFLKVDLATLIPLLRCRVGVAVVPGRGGPPMVLLAAKVGAQGGAREGVGKFLQQLAGLAGGVGAKAQVGGIEVTQLGAVGVCFGYRGDTLLLGTSREAIELALSAQAPKLPALAAFQQARGMGSSPVALLTYNHEALMKSFGPMVPPQVQAVLKATGLDGTRLVGLRLGAKGRALVGTFFIQTHGERRGLLKALAAAPIDKALLKLAPRDARIAWATNVDPTELYDATVAAIHAVAASVDMEGIDVLGGIRAFEAKAGLSLRDDLFGALNRGTVVTTSGGSILIPALIVSQGAKDADRFEATLGKLVGQLDAVIKEAKGPGSGAALRTIEFRGHTIRYLATPMVPVPLAPCYTRLGGRIVFALTPVHLKDYLVFLDKGEPSVLDHPDCRKLVALVPANATSLAYSDAGEGFVQLYGMFAPMLASVAQAIPNSPVPIDLVNLPSKRVLRKHLFGAISYSFATKDTIVFESQSPFGVSVLGPAPAGAAALASTAVLAGMLLPALARAREEARLIRNRNYLNQIAKGCAVYLNEHGDNRFYPSGIAELVDKGVIRDKKILVSPLDRAPPKLANGVPCSFVSCFDKYPDRVFRDDFPPNIMMAWDRISFARGQRSVLFFDSHVELVDEWRFERLLKELDELVKKNTTPRKGAKKKGQRI